MLTRVQGALVSHSGVARQIKDAGRPRRGPPVIPPIRSRLHGESLQDKALNGRMAEHPRLRIGRPLALTFRRPTPAVDPAAAARRAAATPADVFVQVVQATVETQRQKMSKPEMKCSNLFQAYL